MSEVVSSKPLGMLSELFLEGDPDALHKHNEAENVRRVERLLTAFIQGRYEIMDDLLADDVVMEVVGPADAFMVGRHEGRYDVADAVRANFSMVEDQQPVIDSVVAQGNQVVLAGRDRGTVVSTGRPYNVSLVQIYTFRDGLIVRMHEIVDSMAWIESAGKRTQEA